MDLKIEDWNYYTKSEIPSKSFYMFCVKYWKFWTLSPVKSCPYVSYHFQDSQAATDCHIKSLLPMDRLL